MSKEKQNTPKDQKENQVSGDSTSKSESNTENSAIHTEKPKRNIKGELEAWRNYSVLDKTQIILTFCNLGTLIAFIWVGSCQHIDTKDSIARADSSIAIARQNDSLSGEHSKIENRAWVGLESEPKINPENATPHFTYFISVTEKNFGKTPAGIIYFGIDTTSAYKKRLNVIPEINKMVDTKEYFLQPGETRTMRIDVGFRIRNQFDNSYDMPANRFFMVYGKIVYRTIYAISDSLEFCFVYNPKTAEFENY